jgi:NADH dehydrogenase
LVFVDDVADAVVVVLRTRRGRTAGNTYELGGPEQLSMMEINQSPMARGAAAVLSQCPMASGLFASLPGTPMSKDHGRCLNPAAPFHGMPTSLTCIVPRPLGLFLTNG